MDLPYLVEILSAVSSIAVIAGAVFVVFQLRQNARLIEATLSENRANVSIALLERITNENFARRRKTMHDTIKKYAEIEWKGFDDGLDDFEARNFAYTYELIGQLAKERVIDLRMAMNTLQYLVVLDWEAFQPLSRHLMARYGMTVSSFQNFEWLAEQTKKHLSSRQTNTGRSHDI